MLLWSTHSYRTNSGYADWNMLAVQFQRYSRVTRASACKAWRPRLHRRAVTLALNRRSLVSLTEVHFSCVLHQRYCFANAQPPSSHLLLTPRSFFSHPVLHHCFPSLRIKVTRSGWTDPPGSLSIYLLVPGGGVLAACQVHSETSDFLTAASLVCPHSEAQGQIETQKAQMSG